MAHGAAVWTTRNDKFISDKARVQSSDILPLGCRVLFKGGPGDKKEKGEEHGKPGVYLGVSGEVASGSVIGIIGEDGRTIGKVVEVSSVKAVMYEGVYDRVKGLTVGKDAFKDSWTGSTWIECCECKKWRLVAEGDAEEYKDKDFKCSELSGTSCGTPQDPRAWDNDEEVDVPSGSSEAVKKSRKDLKAQKVGKVDASGGVHKVAPKGRPPKGRKWDPIAGKYVAMYGGVSAAVLKRASREARKVIMHEVRREEQERQAYMMVMHCIMQGTGDKGHSAMVAVKAGSVSVADQLYPERHVDCWKVEWEREHIGACGEGAHVYKELSAEEAQQRPKFLETVQKEINKILGQTSIGPPRAFCTLPSGARVYRAKCLYGIKQAEMEKIHHTDKARLVTGGNLRILPDGSVQIEKFLNPTGAFWAPTAELASTRMCCAHAAVEGNRLRSVDLQNAYLQAKYADNEVYVEFPKGVLEALPTEWRRRVAVEAEKDPQGRVVFGVLKALYGLPRSGKDFVDSFHDHLTSLGWRRFESDQACFYRHLDDGTGKKRLCLLVSYVDDLLVSAPDGIASETIWGEIRGRWESTPEAETDRFLGIIFEVQEKWFDLSQEEYIDHCIKKYEEAERTVVRPRKTFPPIPYCGTGEKKGRAAPSLARSVIGGLMYGARGTCPHICRAVTALAGLVHKWDGSCDDFMEGVLGYIKYHRYGIRYPRGKEYKGWENWELKVHSDSNFVAPCSTSGSCVFLQHKQTGVKMLLDWSSKRQGSCSLSSCEAEVIALTAATKQAIKWSCVFGLFKSTESVESVMDVETEAVDVGCDNMAACLAVKRGFSKQLMYLNRTFGNAIQWMHERVGRGDVVVRYVAGVRNFADPFTKLMDTAGVLPELLVKRGDTSSREHGVEGACDQFSGQLSVSHKVGTGTGSQHKVLWCEFGVVIGEGGNGRDACQVDLDNVYVISVINDRFRNGVLGFKGVGGGHNVVHALNSDPSESVSCCTVRSNESPQIGCVDCSHNVDVNLFVSQEGVAFDSITKHEDGIVGSTVECDVVYNSKDVGFGILSTDRVGYDVSNGCIDSHNFGPCGNTQRSTPGARSLRSPSSTVVPCDVGSSPRFSKYDSDRINNLTGGLPCLLYNRSNHINCACVFILHKYYSINRAHSISPIVDVVIEWYKSGNNSSTGIVSSKKGESLYTTFTRVITESISIPCCCSCCHNHSPVHVATSWFIGF